MCVSFISRWFCPRVITPFFAEWITGPPQEPTGPHGNPARGAGGGRRDQGASVVFVMECRIRWVLLPKHFWGGICHIEMMTEGAGVLFFPPVSLLVHKMALWAAKTYSWLLQLCLWLESHPYHRIVFCSLLFGCLPDSEEYFCCFKAEMQF